MFVFLQLTVNVGEIQAGARGCRRIHRPRREQQLIEALIVDLVRQWPGQACRGRSFQISVNGRLSDGTAPGNLFLTKAQAESQTQDFSDFSHGQPFLGHSVPSTFQWRQLTPAVVQRQPLRLSSFQKSIPGM